MPLQMKIVVFIIASAAIVWVSRPSLRNFRSHGFYRFFAWEAIFRHPLYSSLLFLAWGTFFKHPSWIGVCLAVLATFFLTMTAKVEEGENISFFGDVYRDYMKQTKMFVPFLF